MKGHNLSPNFTRHKGIQPSGDLICRYPNGVIVEVGITFRVGSLPVPESMADQIEAFPSLNGIRMGAGQSYSIRETTNGFPCMKKVMVPFAS